jgi:hypothetical protein
MDWHRTCPCRGYLFRSERYVSEVARGNHVDGNRARTNDFLVSKEMENVVVLVELDSVLEFAHCVDVGGLRICVG